MDHADDPTAPGYLGGLRTAPTRDLETASPAPAAAASESGDGRYRVDHELARGGMGRVSPGRDLELGRAVAIKDSLDHDPAVRPGPPSSSAMPPWPAR